MNGPQSDAYNIMLGSLGIRFFKKIYWHAIFSKIMGAFYSAAQREFRGTMECERDRTPEKWMPGICNLLTLPEKKSIISIHEWRFAMSSVASTHPVPGGIRLEPSRTPSRSALSLGGRPRHAEFSGEYPHHVALFTFAVEKRRYFITRRGGGFDQEFKKMG
jgi:hypothetical protein